MRFRLIAVLWLVPTLAQAQITDLKDLFGPADPALKGPAMNYSSTFDKAPESSDVEWKATNEEMRQLGGHMGHLKEGETSRADRDPASEDTTSERRSDHHGKH